MFLSEIVSRSSYGLVGNEIAEKLASEAIFRFMEQSTSKPLAIEVIPLARSLNMDMWSKICGDVSVTTGIRYNKSFKSLHRESPGMRTVDRYIGNGF